MTRFGIIVLALASVSCAPTPAAPHGSYDATNCDSACENLDVLGCRTSSGKPMTKIEPDMSCGDGCRRRLRLGVELHATCVSKAKSCDEVNGCSRE